MPPRTERAARAGGAARLARQSAMLAVSGLLARSAMLLVGFVVARAYGPDEFGRYTAAFALASSFLLFTNLGAGFWLMKLTAQGHTDLDSAYGNALFVTAAIAAIAFPALILASHLLGYSPELRLMVALLGPVVILSSFHELFSALAQGRGQMGIIATFRVLYSLALLAAAVIARLVGGTLAFFALLALILVFVITIAWFISTLRVARPRLVPSGIPALLRGSWLYGLATLFFVIYFRIDSVMLAIFRTPSEVGQYGAAYQVVELLLKVPILVSFVTLPIAFQVGNSERMLDAYRGKLRHLAVLGMLCSLGVYALADPILHALVGGRFGPAVAALRILAPALWIKFVGVAAADLLTTSDKQARRTILAGLAALVNIGLNLYLIPHFGIRGASWATVVTEALLAAGFFLSLRTLRVGRVGGPVLLWSALALGAGTATAALLAPEFGVVGSALAGMLVTAGVAAATGLLRISDLRALTLPLAGFSRSVSP